MRKTTDLFLIDGQPMLAPDENMQVSREDIETVDSLRDESGFLHRFVARQGVGKWDFSYGHLSQQEYDYMESLFAGKASFVFTHPDGENSVQTIAYRSKHSIVLHRVNGGQFRDYRFSIIAC